MTDASATITCRQCGETVDPTGPAIALAGANGFSGPAFVAFVELAPTLGTGGVVHVTCYTSSGRTPTLADLLHAPKARAMGRP